MNTVWIVAMAGQKARGFTTPDCTAQTRNDVFAELPMGKAFSVTQEVRGPNPRTIKLGSVWFQLDGACQIKSLFQHISWDKVAEIAFQILQYIPKLA
jgi:hypothetical protein